LIGQRTIAPDAKSALGLNRRPCARKAI